MIKHTHILSLLVWVIGVYTNSALAVRQQPDINDVNLHPFGLAPVGIRHLQHMEPNLTGEGVKMLLVSRSLSYINELPKNDYQPWTEHPCFETNNINVGAGQISEAGISPHSTAICSILVGEDSNTYHNRFGQINYQGIVPAADLEVTEFWHFLVNDVFEQSEPDADVLITAMGSQFEEWWTRGIDALAEKYGLTVIAAIGNGREAHDPPLYPAASANAIAVGVVDSVYSQSLEISLQNFALAYPEHSTYGPTIDERCKPDIIAPGNLLVADINEGFYGVSGSFTSFSTPVVAGTAALMMQEAKQDPNLNQLFSSKYSNCLIKAILLNSADKLPFWHKGKLHKDDDHKVPLDYLQGAGMLNAEQAYLNLSAGQQDPGDVMSTGWDLNQLPKTKSDARLYRLTVNDVNNSFITATVCWNKHYQTKYPFEPLIEKDANLRLELWAVNPSNPNDHYLLDYSDSDNDNLEHIHTRIDPNYTSYEIIILNSDFESPFNAEFTQPFAAAWSISPADKNDDIRWYDLNADGIVNDYDIKKLFENCLSAYIDPEDYLMGDMNSDGVFDLTDFKAVIDNKDRRASWYTDSHPE